MRWRKAERRVVDNRVLLLGLDELYRDAIKLHERGELLEAAREVAARLDVQPAAVPVEGYYYEDERLTEYFLVMRALGAVEAGRIVEVEALASYRRLAEVTSAPLYGEPQWDGKLLPAGRDALGRALDELWPSWNVAALTEAARSAALAHDDISLVGLAARAGDPVVLAALRESVVLYAEVPVGAAARPPKYVYVWDVDPDLTAAAERFIDTFNTLFDADLPAAEPDHARQYWSARQRNRIIGRCARLGRDDAAPPNHYHWAVGRSGAVVDEFWDTDVWTTQRYRSERLGWPQR